jgi:uncharacterized protein (DUF924 family)
MSDVGPDEVLAFWFGEPASTSDELGRKIRRWFMGGPELDAEIRDRFTPIVERALQGELDEWTQTPRGRLALILLLDQFTRSIYRNDPRSFSGDARAQALALEAVDRGLEGGLTIEQRQFLHMPLLHAESLALQDRSIAAVDALTAEASALHQQFLGMGAEQARKYRDIIARFGRFPHRNEVLGRTSTPEEREFLVDWQQKMPPSAAPKLPS